MISAWQQHCSETLLHRALEIKSADPEICAFVHSNNFLVFCVSSLAD